MKYFVINNTSRAANYGIGTYITQLKDCLVRRNDIELSFIDMCAEVKEYTVEQDSDGRVHYKIPQIAQHLEDSLYCRNAFYFLSQHIHPVGAERFVFHFNYFQHYPLALRLKSYIPSCHIVLSVHYFGWCFELKGNNIKFREHIQQKRQAYFGNSIKEKYDMPYIYHGTETDSNSIIDSYIHERRFFCLADSVVALSLYAKNMITKDYHIDASKVVVLYNGIADIIPQLELKCKKDPQTQNIIFVGRLDDIKGVNYLIKAFRKLYNSNHLLHLYLVGDGDFGKCLSETNEIWEAVTFTGKIDRDKVRQLYQKATIGVLPSFHEQCSYTAIEMMMYGIPFIGTDSTGLHEMLASTPDNIVHIDERAFEENKFVGDLANKMYRLLNDNTYREISSKAMRDAYCKLYSLDKMTFNYHALVTDISKTETLISNNMLVELDGYMISLINSRPDIDMKFFGMSGIGYYIWRRICDLRTSNVKENVSRCLLLQEYMIYYLDWMIDSIKSSQADENKTTIASELKALLSELYSDGFYQTAILLIVNRLSIDSLNKYERIDTVLIYGNAIKIYGYDLN